SRASLWTDRVGAAEVRADRRAAVELRGVAAAVGPGERVGRVGGVRASRVQAEARIDARGVAGDRAAAQQRDTGGVLVGGVVLDGAAAVAVDPEDPVGVRSVSVQGRVL